MTTGRINQVARKVGTHATPKETHARKPSDKPSARQHTPRDRSRHASSQAQGPTDSAFSEPHAHRGTNDTDNPAAVTDQTSLAATCGTPGPRTKTRLCDSCKRHASTKTPARATQQASTRKSQCSVHKPHSRPTANDAQARSNATNVDATKTWRTNREGAAPLTPAVQPPDPTQHRS